MDAAAQSAQGAAPPVVHPTIVGKGAHDDPKPVLAVLPIADLSAEADEYFADGLTEDIITNLARFRDLRVIGGASSLQFKGRASDLSDLCARTLATSCKAVFGAPRDACAFPWS